MADTQQLGRESARNRATRIISEKPLIQGTIVESFHTCGNLGCKCHTKGQKHPAIYLAVRHNKKRNMLCVPEKIQPYVKECIANYQHLQQALDIISRDCIEVFLTKKRDGKKLAR